MGSYKNLAHQEKREENPMGFMSFYYREKKKLRSAKSAYIIFHDTILNFPFSQLLYICDKNVNKKDSNNLFDPSHDGGNRW